MCSAVGPAIQVHHNTRFNEVANYFGQGATGPISGSTSGASVYILWESGSGVNNNPNVGAVNYKGAVTGNVWYLGLTGSSFTGIKDGNECQFSGIINQGSVMA